MSRALLFLLAACAAALPACTTRPAAVALREAMTPASAAGSLPASDYYVVPGAVPQADVEKKGATRTHVEWKVDLPFRAPAWATEKARKPIRFAWFQPTAEPGTRRPLVLISPILGSDTDFVVGFAQAFAARGWHAAIVRRPKIAYDEALPLTQVEDGMRVAVMRQRQVLDWFLARDDVDPARLGTFGISAGGILNSIVAATDDRYAAHVICLAGGPLCDVLVETTEDGLEELVDKAVAQEKVTREVLREELRKVLKTDPVAVAPGVDPSKVLLFLARFDETVPTHCGRKLWRAMGKPPMVMVPLGHYTSILLLPWVKGRTVDFLTRKFDER